MRISLILITFVFVFTQGVLTNFATETGQARQFQKLQEGFPTDTRFLDYYEKLLENPKAPQTHLALAQLYLEKNLLELAVSSFKRALSLQPNLAVAHFGLSRTFRKKKIKELELSEMLLAVQIDPKNFEYHYELGVLYMEPANFDYKKAKKQYKILVKAQSPLAEKLGTLMQIDS